MATTLTQCQYAAIDLAALIEVISIQLEKTSPDELFRIPTGSNPGFFTQTKSITSIPEASFLPLVPLQGGKRPFIQDGLSASICGAMLPKDGEEKLKKTLTRLVKVIDEHLDVVLHKSPNTSFEDIVCIDRDGLNQIVAKQMEARHKSRAKEIYPTVELRTDVHPATISSDFPKENQDIRLLNAVIKYEAVNLEETIAQSVERAIRRALARDPEEAFDVIQDFHRHRQRTDADPTRLHSLVRTIREKGMGRIEREIGLLLLKALGGAATTNKKIPELTQYLTAVLALANFGEREGLDDQALELSLGVFGIADRYSFRQEMMLTSAFDSLPVRIVPSGFISDEVFGSREIQQIANSYHVILNGSITPSEGISFDSVLEYRLDQIERALSPEKNGDEGASRFLAKKAMRSLATLWLCLPDGRALSMAERFMTLKQLLEKGRDAVRQGLDELRSRSQNVQIIAASFHTLLKDRKEVLGALVRQPFDLHLCLLPSILDRVGIKQARPFLSFPPDREEIGYLAHLTVTHEAQGGMFASFPVTVHVSEKWVTRATKEQCKRFVFQREIPEKMAYLVLYPGKDYSKSLKLWRPETGHGIYVAYDPKALKRGQRLEPQPEAIQNLKAIAHEVFTYILLRRLMNRLKSANLPVVMVRFQPSNNADELIYAQLKTIEFVLGELFPITSQGLSLENDNTSLYRRTAAAWGMLTDFPAVLTTGTRPTVDRVAVVAFTGRPTDRRIGGTGPIISPDDGHALFGEIILFEATQSGWRITNPRRFIHLGNRSDDLSTMRAIKFELERVRGAGFRKVLCIAREFQSPRFGLSEEDRRPYLTPAVFDSLAEALTDCDVYPLVKGAYEGVRVGKLDSFETLIVAGAPLTAEISSAVVPVLTVANLRTVGTRRRTTHSSCSSYYIATGAYSDPERRARLTSELLSKSPLQETLHSALLGLHFFRYEKEPNPGKEGLVMGSKLDPFSTLTGQPNVGQHSETLKLPVSRRHRVTVAMLPILKTLGTVLDIIQ